MNRSIQWWEPIAFFVCLTVFVGLRIPLVPYWWTDFQSDFAMVGIMAQHTKLGDFPIYFWGQNYMGGAEWLTAAILSKIIDGNEYISHMVLRINSLSWWLAAYLIWFVSIRRNYILCSYFFFFLMACSSEHLLKISVLQELSPQALFFGGWIYWILSKEEVKPWLGFGALVGVAWWTNQSVVFFLLPALLFYHLLPSGFFTHPQYREIFSPQAKLKKFYPVALVLIFIGIAIALFGGLHLQQPIRLKVPNGISLVRDVAFALIFLHLSVYGHSCWKSGRRPAFLQRSVGGFVLGFLGGFAPAWLGKILKLYESSYGVGLSILPIWRWPEQAMDLMRSIYTLFFSGSFVLMVVFLLGFTFSLMKENRKNVQRSPVLPFCLLVIVLNFVYVFFSERSEGAPVRYLYPAYLAFYLSVAFIWTEVIKQHYRWVGILALITASFSFAWQAKENLVDLGARSVTRKIQLDSLVHLIHAEGYQACWGDYWTSHTLSFLLEEKVAIAPHPDSVAPQVRRKNDFENVKNRNPDCYLFRNKADVLAPVYFSESNPWIRK